MKNRGIYVNVTTFKKGNSILTRFFNDMIDAEHYMNTTRLRVVDWGVWWEYNHFYRWESQKH